MAEKIECDRCGTVKVVGYGAKGWRQLHVRELRERPVTLTAQQARSLSDSLRIAATAADRKASFEEQDPEDHG